MPLGIEVKAERLLEELDNGALLCQLIAVLQAMVKTRSPEEAGVSRCVTVVLYLVHTDLCVCISYYLWKIISFHPNYL